MSERPHILVVDDDRLLLKVTCSIVGLEFDVLSACSGADALVALQTHRIDVVCTDYDMPGMTGHALLARAHREDPAIGRVLITGMPETFAQHHPDMASEITVLQKPYDAAHLLRVLWHEVRERRVPTPSFRRGLVPTR